MTSNQAKIGYIDALKQIIETMNFNADVEKFIEVSQTIFMFTLMMSRPWVLSTSM